MKLKPRKFDAILCRYGREEMLALFEKQDEIHPELAEAPNLISKEPLTPISLIPLTEEDQVNHLLFKI